MTTTNIEAIQADMEYRADMLAMHGDDFTEWMALQEEEARMMEIERADNMWEMWGEEFDDGESCRGIGDDYYIDDCFEGWPD